MRIIAAMQINIATKIGIVKKSDICFFIEE
jgi:hypothetical protein